MANRITTIFDFKEEGRGLSKIKADIQGVDGAWNKARTGFKSAMTEFKNSGVAQAAVGAAALKIAQDSVTAASNLEESANAVATTFDEASGDIAELADDAAEKYGLSQRAFNELAVAFSGFASQIVGEGGDIASTVDEMATRVADFASVHNLELNDAMVKFQSTLAGETEAIRRYGIDVSAAAVKTHAYEKGIAAVGSELTEAQKVQARYSLLMQETEQWAGDFAATSDGLANSQRILKANIEDLQAQLGEHLVPALSESTSQMNELLAVAKDLKLIDLGAEFARWADASPMGMVRRFQDMRQAATDVKFSLDEFDGSAEELRDTLEDLGYDQDDVTAAVEHYTKAQGEAVDATGEATEAVEEQVDAAKIIQREIDLARERVKRFGSDGVENMDAVADATEDGAGEVREFRSEWDRMLDRMSDRSAWLDVEDAFDNLQSAWSEAIQAQKDGAEDAEQKARDAERAMIDLKSRVIEYTTEVEDIPDEITSHIMALIDQGRLAQAEAMLDALERTRQINYVPIVQPPRTPGGFRAMASGGRSEGGPTVVGERGPELVDLPRGARVRSASETITDTRNSGGRSTAATVNHHVTLNVNAGMGANGTQLGRQIAEALDQYYRNGGRRV